jgi:hypothetical protein
VPTHPLCGCVCGWVGVKVDFIKAKLESDDSVPGFCLVVHNIDGATIRNKTSQTVLSMLADIPKV